MSSPEYRRPGAEEQDAVLEIQHGLGIRRVSAARGSAEEYNRCYRQRVLKDAKSGFSARAPTGAAMPGRCRAPLSSIRHGDRSAHRHIARNDLAICPALRNCHPVRQDKSISRPTTAVKPRLRTERRPGRPGKLRRARPAGRAIPAIQDETLDQLALPEQHPFVAFSTLRAVSSARQIATRSFRAFQQAKVTKKRSISG